MLDIHPELALCSLDRVGALDRPRKQDRSTSMQVRRPTDMQDIDKLVRLGNIMAVEGAYSFIQFNPDKLRKLGARVLVDTNEDTFFVRMIERDDDAIAMMIAYVTEYFFSSQRIAQDFALYVHPDHRGSSAALRLIKTFKEWTKSKDIVEECLGITEGVNNEQVAKLYEKLGYHRAGYIYKRKVG